MNFPLIITGLLIVLIGTLIAGVGWNWEKVKDRNKKTSTTSTSEPVQPNFKSVAIQATTLGNNSPVTTIGEQKIFMGTSADPTTANAEMIEKLKKSSMWSPSEKGDRRSYARLISWRDKAEDSAVKDLLISAIEDIENYYAIDIMQLHIDPVPNIFGQCICKKSIPPCTAGFEPPEGFDALNVMDHLTRMWWQERGRAASILRNIRTAQGKDQINKEQLFEKLIERLDPGKENSLFVAKLAFETYKALTGLSPRSNNVFAFEEATKHWLGNKEEILKINF